MKEKIFSKFDGVDFRYFRKCRHFENILFELGRVDYSRLPIFILIRFWEIRKFLTKGLRESLCKGCFFKFGVEVGVGESIEIAPLM
jgi:hypothetical protein